MGDFEFQFISGDDLPEGLRDQITKQLDKQQMVSEALTHDVERFFAELSIDQLVTLRMIFHGITAQGDGRVAAYYEGRVAGMLAGKYDVCTGCGRNHDAEALEVLAKEHKAESEPTVLPAEDEGQGKLFDERVFAPTYIENLRKYHVEPVEPQSRVVKCMGITGNGPCGMTWPSLDDRMLREPDECDGCFQKQRWG